MARLRSLGSRIHASRRRLNPAFGECCPAGTGQASSGDGRSLPPLQHAQARSPDRGLVLRFRRPAAPDDARLVRAHARLRCRRARTAARRLSSRLRRRRAVRLRQCLQGACRCRLLPGRGARRSGRAAGRRGQAHAPCEAAPRRGPGRSGLERLDPGRLSGYSPPSRAAGPVMKKTKAPMKKNTTGAKAGKAGYSPSQLIDAKIEGLGGWRREMFQRLRALIREADAQVVETVKWRKASNPLGVPVWEHDGILCTGETYKDKVKLTFARGAALPDPAGLFNSSLDGNVRRAIDFHEGDEIDGKALKALIRAAVALNVSAVGCQKRRRPRITRAR